MGVAVMASSVSFGNMLKNAGLQGSALSDHRMTTGFGPFELPTFQIVKMTVLNLHVVW